MVQFGLGMPKKILVTQKYVDTSSLGNVTTFSTYVFSANGMYDPNISSGGHQPMYFDQFSALYNHYTVIGSKIVVKVIPISLTTGPGIVSLTKNDDPTVVPTAIEAMIEQSQSRYTIFPAGYSNSGHTLTMTWSAKKTFGGSVLGNDRLQGDINNNPPEQTYYVINAAAYDLTKPAGYYFNVTIEYIAVWDELRDLPSS